MDDTLHIGFQLSGWNEVMLTHIRVFGAKRPLGVTMTTSGGRNGY